MSRCSNIINQVFIEPNGDTTYCCETVPPGTPERKLFHLDNWKAKREYDLRQYNQSKKGWLTECLLCKYSEDRTGFSMRIGANNTHKDNNHIQSAIVKTSNHCNLACRMCSPTLSTHWQRVIRENPSTEFFTSPRHLQEPNTDQMQQLKDTVFTEHLESLVFSGGESLLSKKNYEIIEHLLSRGYAKNIDLHITTNGTVKIKDAWLDASKNFKQFKMEFSIDGGGSVFDYIRPGANWNKLVEVIEYTKQAAPKTDWMFNYVAQALNAHSHYRDQQQIMDLFTDVRVKDQISICYTSPEDTYSVIHPVLREQYGIEDLTKGFDFDYKLYEKFLRKHAWLDKAHGTRLREHNPDLLDSDIYPKVAIEKYDKYIETTS